MGLEHENNWGKINEGKTNRILGIGHYLSMLKKVGKFKGGDKKDHDHSFEVKKLHFSLSSTDNGDWGMNTPAYFCMDDIKGIVKK